MVVKRGAALAAGLVVVAGLLGGCTQKPGVAAVVTSKVCGSGDKVTDMPARVTAIDGSVRWVCPDRSEAKNGAETTISSADLTDVQTKLDAAKISLSPSEVLTFLIQGQTVLQAAEEYGITALDDEVDVVLRTVGADALEADPDSEVVAAWIEKHVGARTSDDSLWLLGQYQVIFFKMDPSSEAYEASIGALTSLAVEVNPRFGVYDPEQLVVRPPTA